MYKKNISIQLIGNRWRYWRIISIILTIKHQHKHHLHCPLWGKKTLITIEKKISIRRAKYGSMTWNIVIRCWQRINWWLSGPIGMYPVIPEHMKPCMHILDLPKLKTFLTLKVNFLCQNYPNFSLRNINLGAHILLLEVLKHLYY